MKPIKLLLPALLILGAALSQAGFAAPKALTSESQLKASKSTYALFTIDSGKLDPGESIRSLTDWLTTNLASSGITPCVVTGDLNATNMNCGAGNAHFGPDFFTHNFDSILPNPRDLLGDPKLVPKAIGITEGVNFVTPAIVGTFSPPRVVQFRFDKRMSQFGMWIDPRNLDGSDQGGLEIIVNRQPVRIGPLAAGAAAFVGVEDPHGFTEITIVPYGSSQYWIANYFSTAPLAGL